MEKQISFEVSRTESGLIRDIVKRAAEMWQDYGVGLDPIACEMDLTACHANGCPLKLRELLEAEPFDFAHDVGGIMRHLNRRTGKLEDFFLPRFADPPVAA